MKYINVDSYSLFHRVSERDGVTKHTNTDILVHNEKKQPQFNGNIYIMTSNKIFSSATLFTMVVQGNNIGKVVGEIPRNKPTGYGDIIRILLPNSKLGLYVSKFFLSGLMKNRTTNH